MLAFNGQIIDIFVSSPGEVARYRGSILEIVQAWNQRNGRAKNLFFNCLRWEDLVASEMGDSGQDVINQQIGDEYDIYLGVMWTRFGTPTDTADSGTEEEFERAAARHRAGDPLKVSFLFCTAAPDFNSIDAEQLGKVQSFKKRVQDAGCLTRDFIDDATLINAINLILDRFANTWESNESERKAPGPLIVSNEHGKGSKDKKIDQDEEGKNLDEVSDLGILDVLEEYASNSARFIAFIEEWATKLHLVQSSAEQTTQKLSQLSKFGKPDPSHVRPIIGEMAKDMDEFGDWSEDTLQDLEVVMKNMSTGSLQIVDLSRDFEEPIEDVVAARNTMSELVQTIDSTNASITTMVSAIEKTPRLDKRLNKANRKVVSAHKELLEKNRLFKEDLLLCIDDLEDRIADKRH